MDLDPVIYAKIVCFDVQDRLLKLSNLFFNNPACFFSNSEATLPFTNILELFTKYLKGNINISEI